MQYQRYFNIERRLHAVLDLIHKGGYSTPLIAQELGVSIPTVSRAVLALRERGHEIRAERTGDGWRYVLASGTALATQTLATALAEAGI